MDQFQEVVAIVGRPGEYVLSRPGRSQSVENGPPVLVRVAVGDRIRHAPTAFPRLGAGRSPVVRVATQLGDALDLFFCMRHEKIVARARTDDQAEDSVLVDEYGCQQSCSGRDESACYIVDG